MYSLNRAMILGNATRDTEMRYTPNGQAVANFGVATNRKWKTQTGDMQEKTEFHDIVAWGKLAEIAGQIIKKGGRVYVEGRLQTRNWEAPDGAKRQKTEIVAENIIALSPKSETSGISGSQESSVGSQGQSSSPASQATSNPHEGIDSTPKEDESQAPAEEASPSAKKEKEDKKTNEDDIDLNDIPF